MPNGQMIRNMERRTQERRLEKAKGDGGEYEMNKGEEKVYWLLRGRKDREDM